MDRHTDAYRRPALYEQLVRQGKKEGLLPASPSEEEVHALFQALHERNGSSIPEDWIGNDLSAQDLDDLWAHVAGYSERVSPDGLVVGWYKDKPHQVIYRLLLRLTRAEAELAAAKGR